MGLSEQIKSETFVSYSYIKELLDAVDRFGLSLSDVVKILEILEENGLLVSQVGDPVKELNNQLRYRCARIDNIENEREIIVAKAMINLLSKGAVNNRADLEILSEYLHLLLHGNAGDRERPFDSVAIERARQLLARALIPAVKDLMVPKWVFDSLEKELRTSREKMRHMELEVDRLRRLLRSHGLDIGCNRLYIVSGLLEEYPATTSDQVAKLLCPWCREPNRVSLPPKEEIEEAAKGLYMYRVHCISCARTIDIEPEKVLHILMSGLNNK